MGTIKKLVKTETGQMGRKWLEVYWNAGNPLNLLNKKVD